MLRNVKDRWHGWRTRKAVERLEMPPAPQPSEIADYVADLPRNVKKKHKLEVRRGYRSRHSELCSVQRQILAESVAKRVYEDVERERDRQADEDARYGVAP